VTSHAGLALLDIADPLKIVRQVHVTSNEKYQKST
jgi:hypothetical protein